MQDKNKNLLLYEAIELRNEFDRHIKLIENLIEERDVDSVGYLRSRE